MSKTKLESSRKELVNQASGVWPLSMTEWSQRRNLPSLFTIIGEFGSWENFEREMRGKSRKDDEIKTPRVEKTRVDYEVKPKRDVHPPDKYLLGERKAQSVPDARPPKNYFTLDEVVGFLEFPEQELERNRLAEKISLLYTSEGDLALNVDSLEYLSKVKYDGFISFDNFRSLFRLDKKEAKGVLREFEMDSTADKVRLDSKFWSYTVHHFNQMPNTNHLYSGEALLNREEAAKFLSGGLKNLQISREILGKMIEDDLFGLRGLEIDGGFRVQLLYNAKSAVGNESLRRTVLTKYPHLIQS
ncbi:MAG: hypothetical protein AABW51_01985 [Nanoarchaeota archaeon]